MPGKAVRIAVVGTITAIKGSERLLDCARDSLARGLPLEFHVIGSTDRDAVFSRLRNVRVWGRYREHEVYSRWPRPVSHRLSAVTLAGNLHVHAIGRDGVGAVHDLLRPGVAEPAGCDAGLGAGSFRWTRLRRDQRNLAGGGARTLAAGSPAPSAPPPAHYRGILRSYYGFSPEELARFFSRPARHLIMRGRDRTSGEGTNMHVFTSITANYLPKASALAPLGQAGPSRSEVSPRHLRPDAGVLGCCHGTF